MGGGFVTFLLGWVEVDPAGDVVGLGGGRSELRDDRDQLPFGGGGDLVKRVEVLN